MCSLSLGYTQQRDSEIARAALPLPLQSRIGAARLALTLHLFRRDGSANGSRVFELLRVANFKALETKAADTGTSTGALIRRCTAGDPLKRPPRLGAENDSSAAARQIA